MAFSYRTLLAVAATLTMPIVAGCASSVGQAGGTTGVNTAAGAGGSGSPRTSLPAKPASASVTLKESVTARSDFAKGLGHGSTPAEALAQAGIAAQEGRGDQVLNLISRSGSASFQQAFATEQAKIGPGNGSLLAAALASTSTGPGADEVTSAERDARTWYAASSKVFAFDVAANYAAETQLVIGRGSGSSAADFGRLQRDLRLAIAADQVVFRSNATSGSGAFGGLETGVIIAALLMAAGSAWGLSRRLAEYR